MLRFLLLSVVAVAASDNVVTATNQPLCTSPPCPIGWTYYPLTNSCYKTFFKAIWVVAEAVCVSQGGHLTSIHSVQENAFVNGLARTGYKQTEYTALAWIGLQKVNNEWTWTDGTKVDYFNWAPKQPDNPNTEFCVQTTPDVFQETLYESWSNLNCTMQLRSYVCKKPIFY